MIESLLEVSALSTAIRHNAVEHTVLDGVSFGVGAGQCLGIVGESGCGKSLTLRAIMDLLPSGAERTGGEVRVAQRAGDMPIVVGSGRAADHGLAMVFQDSQAALDPTMRVGRFIAGTVRRYRGGSRREAWSRMLELLVSVGVPAPELRARSFPHELSGGLRQRVAIALALATDPRVLLCDEPTTALDVTLQAQILELLNAARVERGLGMVFVSHDITVIRQVADVIAVMYAGQIVELGPVSDVLDRPKHPYSQALIDAVPLIDRPVRSFRSIPGRPPTPAEYDEGCRFRDRCGHADAACGAAVHGLRGSEPDHRSACVHENEFAIHLETR